ncbi:hypothetical protein [Stenotrophomonas mori]|uniref:MarR family transcriptional regulator n=1 Tax=Stenotrophomonas mori TaxID=2871096 RepID=A0ABT0SID2_9GAMM|nr:hypothetical protein [Stenotrophomonas mori]MCL7715012.1 hypothetical protein [Stenotrophomonas mori]
MSSLSFIPAVLARACLVGGPLQDPVVGMSEAQRSAAWAALRSRVVYMGRWPDLDRLSVHLSPALVTRVCALLSRRQTVAFLVAQLAEVDSRASQEILVELHARGHLQFMDGAADAPAPVETPAAAADGTLRRLWRQLLSPRGATG